MRELRIDDRGVTIPVGYVITLAIAAVLFSVLIAAGGSVLDREAESTVENELEIIGQEVAADLAAADRLARAGESGRPDELVIRNEIPQRTASAEYRLNVTGDEIRLETNDPDVTVTIPLRTTLDVRGSVDGGPIRIVYDPSADELEVVSA